MSYERDHHGFQATPTLEKMTEMTFQILAIQNQKEILIRIENLPDRYTLPPLQLQIENLRVMIQCAMYDDELLRRQVTVNHNVNHRKWAAFRLLLPSQAGRAALLLIRILLIARR